MATINKKALIALAINYRIPRSPTYYCQFAKHLLSQHIVAPDGAARCYSYLWVVKALRPLFCSYIIQTAHFDHWCMLATPEINGNMQIS